MNTKKVSKIQNVSLLFRGIENIENWDNIFRTTKNKEFYQYIYTYLLISMIEIL